MEYLAIVWLFLALGLGLFISLSRAGNRMLRVNLAMIIASWSVGLCMLFYAIVNI